MFDFFEAWAEEREVGLRFEGRACWVSGDPLMLRRAMSNLLSNAMRYTPKGESVTVRVKEADGLVQIVVENPGPPFPRNIFRDSLTAFIEWTLHGSVKAKAAVLVWRL